MSGEGLTIAITLSPEQVRAIAEEVAAILRAEEGAAQPATASPYVSILEAAEILRCGRQRVDNLLSAGKLTRHKDGRRTLVERAELADYLAGRPTGRERERLRRVAPLRPHGAQSRTASGIPGPSQSARPRAAPLRDTVPPST